MWPELGNHLVQYSGGRLGTCRSVSLHCAVLRTSFVLAAAEVTWCQCAAPWQEQDKLLLLGPPPAAEGCTTSLHTSEPPASSSLHSPAPAFPHLSPHLQEENPCRIWGTITGELGVTEGLSQASPLPEPGGADSLCGRAAGHGLAGLLLPTAGLCSGRLWSCHSLLPGGHEVGLCSPRKQPSQARLAEPGQRHSSCSACLPSFAFQRCHSGSTHAHGGLRDIAALWHFPSSYLPQVVQSTQGNRNSGDDIIPVGHCSTESFLRRGAKRWQKKQQNIN